MVRQYFCSSNGSTGYSRTAHLVGDCLPMIHGNPSSFMWHPKDQPPTVGWFNSDIRVRVLEQPKKNDQYLGVVSPFPVTSWSDRWREVVCIQYTATIVMMVFKWSQDIRKGDNPIYSQGLKTRATSFLSHKKAICKGSHHPRNRGLLYYHGF